MNNEDRFKIISNEFADFLVNEKTLNDFINNYPDVSFNRINYLYSVAHIPIEYMNENIIYNYGYDLIPKCYGLMNMNQKKLADRVKFSQISNSELRGEGILLGFVDTGIDYRNKAFQNENNTTRIVSIWDQTLDGENYPKGFYYGTEYKREQINTALKSENPLSIVPSIDENGHGTILAGIAGGTYDVNNGFIGVAPKTEYVIVKLKQAKAYLKEFFFLPQDTECFQENDIMLGINYLVQIAVELERPIVICIGLGSSQGAHLSEGVFNRYLLEQIQRSNIAITAAAGNEGLSGHHYYGEVNPVKIYDDILLSIGDNNPGFFMEFWGNAPNLYWVDVYTPGDILLGHIPVFYTNQSSYQLNYEETTIVIDSTLENSLGGDQFVLFRIKNPSSGTWRFRITTVGDLVASFNLWLPINNFVADNTFFVNSNPYTTITIPGNEKSVVTATAYDSSNQNLFDYASRGFTKDNQPKPDVAAPGVAMLGPVSENQYMQISGTSAAAAYTAGAVTLLLEWGVLSGNLAALTNVQIRSLITSGASRIPGVIYPNTDWGFGILDINNTIQLAKILLDNKR